jgi:CMP/dCMP kinase
MYRSVALKTLREGIPLNDAVSIGELTNRLSIELVQHPDGLLVLLDGEDVTSLIRTPEVDKAVGPVCEVSDVRKAMVGLQRRLAQGKRLIAEGRDMGTVVFPDAPLKFFMIASIESRALRRQKDMEKQGIRLSLDELRKDIERRDERDSNRADSPLSRAADAELIDTTKMNVEEQVDFILERIRQKQREVMHADHD